jgi:fimbrial chaperone protein
VKKILAKIVFLSALLFLSAVTSAQMKIKADLRPLFGISPPRIQIELDDKGNASGEFLVVNVAPTPLSIKLDIINWDLDENGKIVQIPPTEQSLDQALLVNPLTFVIPGNNSQTVRFAIRPTMLPAAGEHKAIIYVREQLPPSTEKVLRAKVAYALPVYATMGDVIESVVVHDLSYNKQSAAIILDIENAGNKHIRPNGFIGLWSKADYPSDSVAKLMLTNGEDENIKLIEESSGELSLPVLTSPLSNGIILGGARLSQVSKLAFEKLAPGDYTLVVSGNISETLVFRTFSIKR